jgi:hypothetical protein
MNRRPTNENWCVHQPGGLAATGVALAIVVRVAVTAKAVRQIILMSVTKH